MRSGSRITWLLLTLLLSGCGFSRHVGNENLTPDKAETIRKGQTTKTDILSLLGPPQVTQLQKQAPPVMPEGVAVPPHLAAAETWSYWSNNIEGTAVVLPFYAQTSSKMSNYILSVFFDSAGTVIDYQETSTQY